MAADEDNPEVPGLAEAIEARRLELELTPGEMIQRSGLTAPGWAPIRAGRRRRYQSKLKYGVAKALEWEPDAVDLLLRGEQPIPLSAGARPIAEDLTHVVERVDRLEDYVNDQLSMLEALIRALPGAPEGDPRSAPGPGEGRPPGGPGGPPTSRR